MTNWLQEVNIRPILNNEDTSLLDKALYMRSIFKYVYRLPAGAREALDWIVGDLVIAGEQDDVEFFDDGLEDLYDWADQYLIWLGI